MLHRRISLRTACFTTAVDDFQIFSATITYERGSNGENNTQCIEVPINDDENPEPPEKFTGRLSSGNPADTPYDETCITINDNDGMVHGTKSKC